MYTEKKTTRKATLRELLHRICNYTMKVPTVDTVWGTRMQGTKVVKETRKWNERNFTRVERFYPNVAMDMVE